MSVPGMDLIGWPEAGLTCDNSGVDPNESTPRPVLVAPIAEGPRHLGPGD